MSKNESLIKDAFPNLELTNSIKEVAKDLDDTQALRKTINSEGGKLILGGLRSEAQSLTIELLESANKGDKEMVFNKALALSTVYNVLIQLSNLDSRVSSLQEVLKEEVMSALPQTDE